MTSTVHSDPTRDPYTGPINLHRPHFVGIGGSAMSALARICAARGSAVTGTDATDSLRLRQLRAAGCRVTVGHDATLIDNATCVVYTAVTEHAEEVIAARLHGIPVVHRAQVLNALAVDRRLVAVSGTHGKSTTTGILAAALQILGADASYAVGADLNRPGSGARHGAGELFVAEADESDRSFHFLTPEIAVVTGIAHDHPENYTGLDAHLDAYTTFAAGIATGGALVVNIDDPGAAHLAAHVDRDRNDVAVATYGRHPEAVVRIEAIERRGWSTNVRVSCPGAATVSLHLNTPSVHHASNAVAALAALHALGYDPVAAAEAVSGFRGVQRRFTRTGQAAGVTVVDCYADHPNEIAADLEAARAVAGDHRVLVLFQPSGHHRVAAFGRDMGAVLAAGADKVFLLAVQGGAPIPGISASIVADAITGHGGWVRAVDRSDAPSMVGIYAEPGDIVLLMGTGDVTELGHRLVSQVAALVTAKREPVSA